MIANIHFNWVRDLNGLSLNGYRYDNCGREALLLSRVAAVMTYEDPSRPGEGEWLTSATVDGVHFGMFEDEETAQTAVNEFFGF